MAIIPGGQQIRTNSSDVDLTNRGNALTKAQNAVYTMDDIIETVGGGEDYEVIVTRLFSQGSGLSSATEVKNTSTRTLTWTKTGEGMYLGAWDGTGPNPAKVYTFASQVNRNTSDLAMITTSGYWYQQNKITARTFRLRDTAAQAGTFVLEAENLGSGGQGYMLVEVRIYP
tara:strand:- start:145 stop:657 length:513 start_codon:yes stop_codon:yes gene_type:complete